MSSRRPSPSIHQKRSLAIKRADGHPLTRADLQYDLLHDVFHDTHSVFTDPYPDEDAPPAKICFRELYIKTILHSPKATKVLKDKMVDSSNFAEDFGMLALLVNVGRVNTTMSFFPEMKTAIRTYHPVPALQRTTGNLQDAPRIKHILKAGSLGKESGNAPSTPADILARVKDGHVPPTTVANLVFVLASHSTPIGQQHFSEDLDFVDLFLRENVSSASRARAFLWLCYHYLEASEDDYDGEAPGNPFNEGRQGQAPRFTFLSESEVAQENVDPEDEKKLGKKLVLQRTEILKAQSLKESNKASGKSSAAGSVMADEVDDELISAVDDAKSKIKRGGGKPQPSPAAKEKRAAAAALRRRRQKAEKVKVQRIQQHTAATESDVEENTVDRSARGRHVAYNQYPRSQPQNEPPPRVEHSPQLQRRTSSETSEPYAPRDLNRYSPYPRVPGTVMPHNSKPHHKHRHHSRRSTLPRSFLEQAWHTITTTDPLYDSDSEVGDEYVRHDYIKRLDIVNKLCRRESFPPEGMQIEP